jgi:hypothetical protein
MKPLVLVDRPYVSDHLRGLIDRHALPVVLTDAARELGFESSPGALTEAEAVAAARAHRPLVYTSSENALPWVARHLGCTQLPGLAALFKDKVRFREALRPRYPDFFFRAVPIEQLDEVSVEELPLPVIVKPAVGFFSLGVQKVEDPWEWDAARAAVRARLEAARSLYPEEVLGTTTLIIEEWVGGEEYAVDAYFDADGDPVIQGIWAHVFASDTDTSDRVYSTSRQIVDAHLAPFRACLAELGRLTDARDLPVHVELRKGNEGLTPIEVNPLRFGGWCTTGDLTARAWGFSPYLSFLEQRPPDWPALLRDAGDSIHSIVVLDNSTGIEGRDIAAFDYDALLGRFRRPLELRRVDWRRHPLFGFLFVETDPADRSELDDVLRSDLREFVTRV